MNDTDVLDGLRAGMAGVHHDQPVDDVVRRGRVLRVRRRAPGLAAAVLAGAGALLAVGTATGPSTAFARWTSEPQATDATTAAAIDTSCRQMLLAVRAPGEPPLDLPPLAVLDRRGDHAVAVYTDGRSGYDCDRDEGPGGPASADSWTWGSAGGGSVTHHDRLSASTPLVINTSGTGWARWQGRDGQISSAWGWVDARVARVVGETDGAQVTAAVSHGVFVAWWPSTDADTSPAAVTAYGADGGVLATATADLTGWAR